MKILYTNDGQKMHVKDSAKDYHSKYGYFSSASMKKNGKITSNKGKDVHCIDADFMDTYEKIKRGAQIIPLKDIGSIITKCGIGKNSKIVDSGSGSGGLSIFLSHVAKEVTTYEIRKDFFELVSKNIKDLDLTNLKIKNKDVTLGIDEKNVDVITYDLPTPWEALDSAKKALKIGGYIVSYSPSIPQVMDFVTACKKDESLLYLETIEILERQWEITERKVRPKSQQIGHSGFLSFVRKIS